MSLNYKKDFGRVLVYFLVWLMSIGFAFGQPPDERKLELVVQTGHPVKSLAFSPQGKILATASTDETVKIWDVESGKELRTLQNCSSFSVAFSPHQKILAGGCFKTIKFWNIETGKELKSLSGHSDYVKSVAFSPDGKILASASADKTVKLWKVETGQEIATLLGHTDSINSVAFNSDGKILASGGIDKTIKFWDVTSGKEIKTIQAYSNNVITSLAFSPHSDVLASGGSITFDAPTERENTVKLWNVNSGLEIKKLSEHQNRVFSLAFSPDGRTLVSGGASTDFQPYIEKIDDLFDADSVIKLWDIETGKFLAGLEGKSRSVHSVAFSSDGKFLASGGSTNFSNSDKTEIIKFWDLQSRKKIKSWLANSNAILRVRLSEKGKFIAFEDTAQSLTYFKTENWKKTYRPFEGLSEHSNLPIFNFSYNEKILAATNGNKGEIALIDTETGKILRNLAGHQGATLNLAFSKDDKILVSCGMDKLIKFWKVETGELIKTFSGHSAEVSSVGFSSDNKYLVSGDANKTIKLWDLESGSVIRNFISEHETAIIYVGISADGKVLTSTDGRTLTEWEIATGKKIKNIEGYFEPYSIAKTSNGQISSERMMPKTIKFFDEKTNQELGSFILVGENEWVIVTPDGRFDATDEAFNLLHYSYGLEIIALEQLKEMYYEPNLLAKIMGFSKEPLRSIVSLKEVKLYPEIIEQKFDEKTGKLTVKLKNRGGGIGETRVLVNDSVVVADARDQKLKANPNIPLNSEVTLTVDLPKASLLKGKENKITVVTSNYLKEIGKGNIQSRGSEVVYLDKGQGENTLPSLYAIVGGVSDYDGDQIDLRFAAKDAEDFSNALSLGAKKLFCDKANPNCLDKVQIKTLSTNRQNADEQPTKENFKKAFAEISQKAKPEDIIVVYLSGHGVTLGTGTDTYFYLTKEARAAGKSSLETNFQTVAISNEELTDWLTPNQEKANDIWIKAQKRVLILDTCAAGNFAQKDSWRTDRDLSGDQIRAMDFLKGKTGTFIMMGSSANQPSYESNKYGQGLLTFALLEGMKGVALQKPTENIDVRLLFDYAEKRVPELGKDINLDQRPIIKQPSGNTFVIGQMTDSEKQKINLPQPKPLMLRPLLTNPETGDDDLKLIPALRKLLDAESSYALVQRSGKGEPVLIYIDDDSFPSAIRVTGTYTVEGETVRVKAFLRKDGKTIATLPEIVGKKEEMVEKLLAEIRKRIGEI